MSTQSFKALSHPLQRGYLLIMVLFLLLWSNTIVAQGPCNPPVLETTTPTNRPVCEGQTVEATFRVTPECDYDFRYSLDGGLTWSILDVNPAGGGTVSTTTITVADDDVIFQGRLCLVPGQQCDEWIDLAEWLYTNLSANITMTPDPPVGCLNDLIELNGNPSGGYPGYDHSWTGSGAVHLDETDVREPTFASDEFGTFTLIYTVSDIGGCSASDQIEFTFRDTIKPELTCPANITVSTDFDSCSAVVCYNIESDDNCPFVLLPEAGPGNRQTVRQPKWAVIWRPLPVPRSKVISTRTFQPEITGLVLYIRHQPMHLSG